ncbi:hypothetical protein ACFYSF_39600 [Streptomyces canus]|uniref:hypothetical protein n=1 Tax=Streptomyces canus TaxID=58343 RepID=UPI00369C77FC
MDRRRHRSGPATTSLIAERVSSRIPKEYTELGRTGQRGVNRHGQVLYNLVIEGGTRKLHNHQATAAA